MQCWALESTFSDLLLLLLTFWAVAVHTHRCGHWSLNGLFSPSQRALVAIYGSCSAWGKDLLGVLQRRHKIGFHFSDRIWPRHTSPPGMDQLRVCSNMDAYKQTAENPPFSRLTRQMYQRIGGHSEDPPMRALFKGCPSGPGPNCLLDLANASFYPVLLPSCKMPFPDLRHQAGSIPASASESAVLALVWLIYEFFAGL